MKSNILTFLLISFCYSITAQELTTESNTLESQFDKIYRTSTSYKKYKVVSKVRFQKLKEDVLDSLKTLNKIILEKENLLKNKESIIKNTQEKINTAQLQLDELNKKENTISFFRKDVEKGTFTIINWSIIALLLIGLIYFLYKFVKSNILTNEAKNNLIDLQEELEQHKKKSLLNEQKLRRQLQDEINKQRS